MPRTRRQTQETESPKIEHESASESSDDEEAPVARVYEFDGNTYDTYQDMVDAKRKRNHDVLVKSGLLNVSASIKAEKAAKMASQRGIAAKKRKTAKKEPLARRKSSRLAGVQADNVYIENESGGRFTFSGDALVGGGGDDAKMSNCPK